MIIKQSQQSHIDAAKKISSAVLHYLEQQKSVLLLTAGGRAELVYDALAKELKDKDLSKLTVSLGDEHWTNKLSDNNNSWSNFRELDFWDVIADGGGEINHIIKGKGQHEDADIFDKFLTQHIQKESYIISWQGLGADGHTSGILPSDEISFYDTFDTDKFAVAHKLAKVHPARITITPTFIDVIDEVFIYAVGEEKKDVLKKIVKLDEKAPNQEWQDMLHKYPVLFLSGKNTLIFTDQDINSN